MLNDLQLQKRILSVEHEIKEYLISKDLWYDSAFTSHLEHVDAEPSKDPVVSILTSDGPLSDALSGYIDYDGAFENIDTILKKHGMFYEMADGVTFHFHVWDDEELNRAFYDFFHWQWICSLIVEDCSDVYQELYSQFSNNPEDLHKLHWREYETLLFRIFQNQGFEAELGPGRGDDGVDIKLLQRDPLGDILSFVQVKKYAPHRKIDLTSVQALYGAVRSEDADHGIFVTTSDYAPVAKRFEARNSETLNLYNKSDVQTWCKAAEKSVIKDKSKLIDKSITKKLLLELRNTPDQRVLQATNHFRTITNRFAVVLKETNHAALLMSIESETISDDGYGQQGYEIPKFSQKSVDRIRPETVWRVKRKLSENGSVSYWDGQDLYFPWDRKPCYFDYCD